MAELWYEPVGVHQINPLSGSEIETDATGLQADEEHFTAGVMLESIHSLGALFALHSSVKTVIPNVRYFERVFNPTRKVVSLPYME